MGELFEEKDQFELLKGITKDDTEKPKESSESEDSSDSTIESKTESLKDSSKDQDKITHTNSENKNKRNSFNSNNNQKEYVPVTKHLPKTGESHSVKITLLGGVILIIGLILMKLKKRTSWEVLFFVRINVFLDFFFIFKLPSHS